MSNFTYYGQFDPPVDKYLYENWPHLTQESSGVIIEAGAADGITESCTYFFEKYFNRKVINIEPDPSWYKRLEINRPNSLNLNYALSNNSSVVNFTRVIHPEIGDRLGHGSIKHKRKHLKHLNEMNCDLILTEVNCITYKDLVSRYKIEKVDLLVLDIEGYEISVLKSLKKINLELLPAVICVEIGWSSFIYCFLILKKLGYKMHSRYEVNAFFFNPRLLGIK